MDKLTRRMLAYQRLLKRKVRPWLTRWGWIPPETHEEIQEGISLRLVRSGENLVFFCSCGFRLMRASPQQGALVEILRLEGLCTFTEAESFTNCRHCHRPTRLPAVYSLNAGRIEAEGAVRLGDYVADALVRIEPRKP